MSERLISEMDVDFGEGGAADVHLADSTVARHDTLLRY
jgi:hypothetical protein